MITLMKLLILYHQVASLYLVKYEQFPLKLLFSNLECVALTTNYLLLQVLIDERRAKKLKSDPLC